MSAVAQSRIGEWQTIPSFELEEESRNGLHEFRKSLARAKGTCHRIHGEEWFDLQGSEDADRPNRPVNAAIGREIGRAVADLGNEFYTTSDFEWLSSAGLNRFDVVRSAKAETSAHGVFFGVMSNEETGLSLAVAVKPCFENPSKAYMDWLNNNLVARSGRKNFAPVGFIYDEDRAYSLTVLNKGVETLDNTDWRFVLNDPENPEYASERQQLIDIGTELANLHDDRIFHEDPQFKNIAIDPTGKTFFIDWESAHFYGSEATTELLAAKAAHDLEVIYFSMAAPSHQHGIGLLSSYAKHLQWEHFRDFIVTPYIERRLENDSTETQLEMLDAIEKRISNYVLTEFSLSAFRKYIQNEK
jgi:tRNA A-37 threonylcarbamoyl transferase component Bud32